MKTKKFPRINIMLITALFATSMLLLNQQVAAQAVEKGKLNKPDVKVNVHREYDDKGNVTRYDSSYSYSWSGSGAIPPDVDSLFRRFNQGFSFGIDVDSTFNNMGFGWSFGNDTLPNAPSFYDKHFQDLFGWDRAITDSSFFDNRNDFFGQDFQNMVKQQQRLMEQFMHQFNLDENLKSDTPQDSTSKIRKEKIETKRQSYKSQKSSSTKTIII